MILTQREKIESIRTVLEQRRIALPPTPASILRNLLAKWPGGLRYNAWYFMHTAQSMGLLDEAFRPIDDAPFVDEGARRIREACDLGGFPTVVAYVQAEYGR